MGNGSDKRIGGIARYPDIAKTQLLQQLDRQQQNSEEEETEVDDDNDDHDEEEEQACKSHIRRGSGLVNLKSLYHSDRGLSLGTARDSCPVIAGPQFSRPKPKKEIAAGPHADLDDSMMDVQYSVTSETVSSSQPSVLSAF